MDLEPSEESPGSSITVPPNETAARGLGKVLDPWLEEAAGHGHRGLLPLGTGESVASATDWVAPT
ncbi:MAG: hypothetical protein ACI9WU_000234 [Myxococcota bacterium]|jgi:hypothetical protein